MSGQNQVALVMKEWDEFHRDGKESAKMKRMLDFNAIGQLPPPTFSPPSLVVSKSIQNPKRYVTKQNTHIYRVCMCVRQLLSGITGIRDFIGPSTIFG